MVVISKDTFRIPRVLSWSNQSFNAAGGVSIRTGSTHLARRAVLHGLPAVALVAMRATAFLLSKNEKKMKEK